MRSDLKDNDAIRYKLLKKLKIQDHDGMELQNV